MKKTVTFVWSIFLLVFISIDMNAQSIKSWDYPIKPGTEAWQALSTHEDMLKACQIPAEILKTVSTEELIELCLAYPLLGDIFAYNGIQEGISKVSARFNGLQELFKRKDNASLLFEKMKKQELLKAGVLTSIEIGNEISRQMVIEALLSNETILSNTNNLLQLLRSRKETPLQTKQPGYLWTIWSKNRSLSPRSKSRTDRQQDHYAQI